MSDLRLANVIQGRVRACLHVSPRPTPDRLDEIVAELKWSTKDTFLLQPRQRWTMVCMCPNAHPTLIVRRGQDYIVHR